jgi:SAM-dependent methyltransferase
MEYAPDLFRGTAGYYDRFRPPYPRELIDELLRLAGDRDGRLLDLACGPGRLAVPLSAGFAEVWAVDQEPDMIEVLAAKATGIRAIVSAAQDLAAAPRSFNLVVIGDAFHRLDRDLIARRVLGWLRPGGYLALCWSSSPWAGPADWQGALARLLDQWRARLGATDRVPANWDQPRRERPDAEVLAAAGFTAAGGLEFVVKKKWTVAQIAGYVRSTSSLPPAIIGPHNDEFDACLAAELAPFGDLDDEITFAVELGQAAEDGVE